MITDISDYFNNLINSISDSIYITLNTDELNNEIENNHFYINANSEIVSKIKIEDYINFINNLISKYQHKLLQSKIEVDLIFYMWFDSMAGQLRFNLINSNHKELPFSCKFLNTNNPDEVLSQFLNSNYLNGIQWNEFENIKNENTNKSIVENFELIVYQKRFQK